MAAAPKNRLKPVNSIDVILTTQGMAAHLGVTPRWLQSLVKDGTLPSCLTSAPIRQNSAN